MNEFSSLGRWLIGTGVVLVILGVVVVFSGKIPGFGRLPGDWLIRREHTTFYFPMMSCLILSVVISVVMHFLQKK